MASILGDTKNQLAIEPNQKAFDRELLLYLNGIFVVLYDMGIGCENDGHLSPLNVQTYSTWEELNCKNELNIVKNYVAFRIKQMWDPPQNSGATKCMEEVIKEYEWRLLHMHEREVT